MSFRAMTWAAGVETATPTLKLILLLLADRADDDGKCWPSINKIAFDACVSRQCVIENIKKLAYCGFLNIEKRTIENAESGKKWNKSNMYWLNIGVAGTMREGSQLGLPPSKGVVNEVDHGSQRGLLGVVNEVDPNLSIEPVIESKKIPTTPAGSAVGSGVKQSKLLFPAEKETGKLPPVPRTPLKSRVVKPPTIDAVIKYALEQGDNNPAYVTKAKEAYEFYEGNMRAMKKQYWIDGNGNKVANWKLKIRNNWFSKVRNVSHKPRAI